MKPRIHWWSFCFILTLRSKGESILQKNVIKPLKISRLTLENNLILAPMAGICLKPFRLAIKKMGAGLVCNEMVSSYGLCYENVKTWQMLDVFDSLERPVSVQIFGDKAEIMAEAAKRLVDRGIEIIDLNMGCPAPKVTNGGAGSALLKNPAQVRSIIAKTRAAVKVPLTVKIRAGWDLNSVNVEEVAKVVEGEGADALIVHARTRSQKFQEFDWNFIARAKAQVQIPVIGNGNLFTPQDVERMYNETGCDGFMIGRATESNPWIFKQILADSPLEISAQMRLDYILQFARDFVAYRGEHGIFEVRKFIVWLTKSLPNATELRQEFFAITSLADVDEIITRQRLPKI